MVWVFLFLTGSVHMNKKTKMEFCVRAEATRFLQSWWSLFLSSQFFIFQIIIRFESEYPFNFIRPFKMASISLYGFKTCFLSFLFNNRRIVPSISLITHFSHMDTIAIFNILQLPTIPPFPQVPFLLSDGHTFTFMLHINKCFYVPI